MIAKNLAEAGNAGQVTPALKYTQAQENYRATLSRQASFANEVGKAGLDNLQKAGSDYATFSGQMANLKSQLAAAKTGDEVAAAFAPVATALGSNAFYGTHRLAPAEVAALGPQLGSIGREVNTWFSKAGSGTLPPASVQEFGNLVDRLQSAKYAAYKQGTDYSISLHKLDPAQTPVMDQNGNITTADKRIAVSAQTPPPGATMKVPASDGKLHWSDGKKDLGVIQ